MSNNMTYSQRKRSKMDYRTEYFVHNPGLFGCVWFCAYCHKPILGRQNVEVDHIMPLNNVLGRNSRYNLVAACRKCNRNKSDKVDGRVAVGYCSKLFEVVLFGAQKIFVGAFVVLWSGIAGLLGLLKKALLFPLQKTSTITKVVYLAALICVALLIYGYFTGGIHVIKQL